MESFWDYRKKTNLFEQYLELILEAAKKSSLAGKDPRHVVKYVLGLDGSQQANAVRALAIKAHSGQKLTPEELKTSPIYLDREHKESGTPAGAILVPELHERNIKQDKKGKYEATQQVKSQLSGVTKSKLKNKKYAEIVSKYKRIKPDENGTYRSNFHAYDPKTGRHLGLISSLPHSRVAKHTHLEGRYNYEHALTRVYNYFSEHRNDVDEKGKRIYDENGPSEQQIQEEIARAIKTKDHDLNMSKADSSHFGGGLPDKKESPEKYAEAVESHNDALNEVSLLVHDLIHNKHFRNNWSKKHKLINSGQSSSTPSQLAIEVHGKEPSKSSQTSKVDGFTFQDNGEDVGEEDHTGTAVVKRNQVQNAVQTVGSKRISLKKASAQIHSGGGADSEILLRAAANVYFGKHMHDITYQKKSKIYKDGKLIDKEKPSIADTKALIKTSEESWPSGKKEQFEHVSNLISHFRHHMDQGNHEVAEMLYHHLAGHLGGDNNIGASNRKESFHRLVTEFAITGAAKFGTHVGTATHVGETGKRGSVHTASRYLDMAEQSGQLTHENVRFRGGKHGASSKGATWTIPTFDSNKFDEKAVGPERKPSINSNKVPLPIKSTKKTKPATPADIQKVSAAKAAVKKVTSQQPQPQQQDSSDFGEHAQKAGAEKLSIGQAARMAVQKVKAGVTTPAPTTTKRVVRKVR